MVTVTDQLQREVKLPKKPERIISLVPSITELLADMQLEKEIVGITKFCIHPDSVYRSKTRIGGTKKVDHRKIDDLNPDIIIASKEENIREDIMILEKKYPVWVSDVKSLDDAKHMISSLGYITGREQEAISINEKITSVFSTLKPLNHAKTLYLIWKNPFMAVGGDTFIHEMLQFAGMENVLQDQIRYPELTPEEIVKLNPQLILLSSEPFPFSEKHIEEIQKLLPDSLVLTANGEYFSWYGSRLIDAPAYFNSLNDSILKLKHKSINQLSN